MLTGLNAGGVDTTYELIKARQNQFSVEAMRRVSAVAPSGYYDWPKQPIAKRGQEVARLRYLIHTSLVSSHGIGGASRAFINLHERGEPRSNRRVARLM